MNRSFTYKTLDKENVKEIVSLQQDNNFSDGWSEDMLINGFVKGILEAFGIYYGEKLIAFLTYSFCDDFGEIQDLLVDGSFRKKGIASTLINNFFETSKKNNIKKIFLEVRESNVIGINFYRKNGFSIFNTRKKYYSDGENAQVMQKTL